MPQARSSQGRRQSGGARKSGTGTRRAAGSAKASGAGNGRRKASSARSAGKPKAASRTTAKAKPKASSRSSAAAKTSSSRAAKPRARARTSSAAKRSTTARPSASARPAARQDDPVVAALVVVRDLLTRGLVITGERLQETMDEAVSRGRMTRDDAEDLVQRLVNTGRKQTDDFLSELEQLIGRSRGAAADASKRARTGVQRAGGTDRVLRTVDRARRAAGIPPSFPIIAYDDLAAAQIVQRLDELSRAELRKVRDYERRNANRKSVLEAIERKLT